MKTNLASMIQLIKRYSGSSIFFRNLKKFTVILSIPFLIFSCIIAIYYDRGIKNTNESVVSEQMIHYQNTVQSALNETQRIYDSLSANSFISLFLSEKELFIPSKPTPSSFIGFLNDLKSNTMISSVIKEIYIYSYAGQYVLSSHSGGAAKKFVDMPWMNYTSDSFVYLLPGSNETSFYVCYKIFASPSTPGIVVFNISLSNLKSTPDYSFYIFNENKTPVYTLNKSENFSPSLNPSEYAQIIHTYPGYIDAECSLNSNCLYLVNNNPVLRFNFPVIITICLCISFLTAFCTALIFSASSYKSIETIIYNFNNITTDNTDVKDELSYITKNILQLSNKAKSLEDSFITKMNELKTMQLSMLQLQFTPHFLFNTLNTVSMLETARKGIDNPESKIIMLLSDLLTEALDTAQYMVTINNEINYSKKYVEIEKIKTNNSFDAIWESDSSLLNCKTVKFSLQPIIENSIRYGIKGLRGKKRGYIKISVTCNNDIITITVFDNGNKINDELLNQIRQNMNAPAPPANHRGMYNVNKRIQLVFGAEYGCSIYSDNTGTSVTIRIPRTEALN